MYFQLDTCRERATLAAMILIDSEGYSVAETGDAQICEALHIELEKLSKVHETFEGTLDLAPGKQGVYMEMFTHNGDTFCVCAAGGDPEQRRNEVQRSQAGIIRILSES